MTLYELTNSINIQGNIEIRIMDESDEAKATLFVYETEELSCSMDNLRDLEDFVVIYIYSEAGILVIEIKEE